MLGRSGGFPGIEIARLGLEQMLANEKPTWVRIRHVVATPADLPQKSNEAPPQCPRSWSGPLLSCDWGRRLAGQEAIDGDRFREPGLGLGLGAVARRAL